MLVIIYASSFLSLYEVSMNLIKSNYRVKTYGEVYTPPHVVEAMLDLTGEMSIYKTFLEPACGNGNFVVAILKRKFDMCKCPLDYLIALHSVVAIDLLPDNVAECKERVKELYKSYGQDEWIDPILDTHIIQGDSLKIMDSWANEKI